MNKETGTGCGLLLLLALAFAAVLWGIAILLYVVGIALVILGLFLLVFLPVHGICQVKRKREVKHIEAQLDEIIQDCIADIEAMTARWDYVSMTRGIGTPLAESILNNELDPFEHRTRLTSAATLLKAATSTSNKITAIAEAERLRLETRKLFG